MKKVSVIIPTYNGRELLEKNLPSVLVGVSIDDGHEIIVMDDGSDDGTREYLAEKYPLVKVVCSSVNQGFGKTCNQGVKLARNKIIILLNNDIKVHRDFLAPLVRHFSRDDVFAVGAKVYLNDTDNLYVGKTELYWSRGFIRVEHPRSIDHSKLSYSAYAGGGMVALCREKFLQLDGFSDIYAPFYWEDLDLCYRAWGRGWKTMYEPESIMIHAHQGTIGKLFSQEYVEAIKTRNSMYFVWRNIRSKRLFCFHLLWLPLVIISSLLTGRVQVAKILVGSLSNFSSARRKMMADSSNMKISDAIIISYPNQKMRL